MNVRKYTSLASVALLAFLAYAPATYAQKATANMTVSADVDPACTVSANNLTFPDYIGAPGLPDTLGSTTIDVTCANLVSYQVGLDNGLYALGTRRMLHGTTDFLQYELYTNAIRTLVWDMNFIPGNPNVVSKTGTGLTQSIPVYGKIFAGQNLAPAGGYQDTIVVTVNW